MIESLLPLGNDVTAMNMLPMPSIRPGVNARVDAAAQEFEAMFAAQLLQPMFESVPVNGVFGGGHGEEIMRSFMLQEYGKMIAQKGLLGIAPQVKNEMLRAQESAKTRGEAAAPWAQTEKTDTAAKEARYVSQR